MKTALKWTISILVSLVILVIAMFLATRSDYPVERLVTDDPSLPSQTVAGVQLHLRIVQGPAGAPTVIVLHGGPGGDFRSLQALDALTNRYHVVFYDQRGAGLSERVSADMLTLDGHLEELQGVIDVTSPNQAPILIGHSWGAMLAAAFLGQNPDAVESAVLIEPGYLDAEGRQAWEEESRTYTSGPRYVWEAVTTGFRAQHVSGPDVAAPNDFLIVHMVGVFTNHPDNPYHCGGGYTAPNWRFGALSSATWRDAPSSEIDRLGSRVAAFQGPVLLIAGACNDWLGPLQRRNLSRFTNAELVSIPNAGHDVLWDNPEATRAAIRSFLDE